MTKAQAKWTTPAPPAEPRQPRSGFVGPAFFVSCRSIDAATDGLALTAAMMRNDFSLRLLQARRLALMQTARHLRNQMRCSEASICEAELRAVTLEILASGDR